LNVGKKMKALSLIHTGANGARSKTN
jgi:hypothetical protein